MAVWAIGTILFYSLMATKYPTIAYIANSALTLSRPLWAIDSFHQEDRHRLWLIVIIPALLFGLLFAALNFFTSKAPFPVDGLLLLTIFIAIMAFLILLAWWQKSLYRPAHSHYGHDCRYLSHRNLPGVDPLLSIPIGPKPDYGTHNGTGLLL